MHNDEEIIDSHGEHEERDHLQDNKTSVHAYVAKEPQGSYHGYEHYQDSKKTDTELQIDLRGVRVFADEDTNLRARLHGERIG